MSETRLLNIAKRWRKARAAYFEAVAAWRRDGGLNWQAARDYTYSAWQAAELDLAAAVAEYETQHAKAV